MIDSQKGLAFYVGALDKRNLLSEAKKIWLRKKNLHKKD